MLTHKKRSKKISISILVYHSECEIISLQIKKKLEASEILLYTGNVKLAWTDHAKPRGRECDSRQQITEFEIEFIVDYKSLTKVDLIFDGLPMY